MIKLLTFILLVLPVLTFAQLAPNKTQFKSGIDVTGTSKFKDTVDVGVIKFRNGTTLKRVPDTLSVRDSLNVLKTDYETFKTNTNTVLSLLGTGGGTSTLTSNSTMAYDSTHTLTTFQGFSIPEGVVNGDYVGTWIKTYTWRSGNQVAFEIKTNYKDAFSINSSTGLVTIVDATKINGKVVRRDTTINLIIRSTDEVLGAEEDTLQIRVKENSYCKFIDYSYSGTESGTRTQPYNDLADAGVAAGYGYFVKRGNTPTGKSYTFNSIVGTATNPTIFGSYGAGALPTFDGTGASGDFFRVYNVPSTCQYMYFYDWFVKNYPAHAFRVYTRSKYIEFYNMKFATNILTANASDLADIYFYGSLSDSTLADRCYLKVVNAESAGSLGPLIKCDAPGLTIVNYKCEQANTIAQKKFNLRLGTWYSTASHVLLIGGDRSLQMRLAHTKITDAIVEGATEAGFFGLFDGGNNPMYDYTFDNIYFKNCAQGFYYYDGPIQYFKIRNCLFRNNTTYGIYLRRGGPGNIIERCTFINNPSGSIYLENNGGVAIHSDLSIRYCTSTGSASALACGSNATSNIKLFNNTFDGTVAITGSGAVARNNFYKTTLSGVATASNNIDISTINTSSYFQDYNNDDYRLKNTGTAAIDAGYFLGLPKDIVNNTVPNNAVVDIGAYEYTPTTSTGTGGSISTDLLALSTEITNLGYRLESIQDAFDNLTIPEPTSTSTDTMNVLFKLDFQNTTAGAYSESEWTRDWNPQSPINDAFGYGTIINESGNKFQRITFPAGTFKLEQHGAQWKTPLSASTNEAFMTYRVRFSSGFNGANAYDGKLPGLGGGGLVGGGNIPTGTTGWDARYMFKTGMSNIRFYLYYWEMFNTSYLTPTNTQYKDASPISGKAYYGIGLPFSGSMGSVNNWLTITQRIKMNTVGQRNGEVEGFINGQRRYLCTGIDFRTTNAISISNIVFSIFFGGSGIAPINTEYIDMDDFIVYEKKVVQVNQYALKSELTAGLAPKAPLNSPTLVTPNIGVATATSINKVAITAPATSATLTIANGKTATVNNTLTLAGTDGSTLNVGNGGTLGTGAYATISNYVPTSRTISINGESKDLSTNPSFTVSGSGGVTASQVHDTANVLRASIDSLKSIVDGTTIPTIKTYTKTAVYVADPGVGVDITANLTTAYNAAPAGSIIILPEGIFPMTGSLLWTKKVSLKGQGKNKTILYRPESMSEVSLAFSYMIWFQINSDTDSNIDIYDITFRGKKPSIIDEDGLSTARDMGIVLQRAHNFRVFNCRFENFGEAGIEVKHSNTLAGGVIFNNEFYRNCKGENGQGTGYGIHVIGTSNTWVSSPAFGTSNFIFIEDNYFEWHRHAIAADGGALYVARYNTILNNLISHAIDMHGIDDLSISTRATEIYNNTIIARFLRYDHETPLVGTVAEINIPDLAIGIRGGESLVYNNTATGYNHFAVLMMEQTDTDTYPEYTQIGYASGTTYGSSHTGTSTAYGNGDCFFWNNTWTNPNSGNGYADIYYESDGNHPTNMIVENRDWHRVAKPGYTAYTYPHPLRAGN